MKSNRVKHNKPEHGPIGGAIEKPSRDVLNKRLKFRRERFLRRRMDRSGTPRPDLWIEGVKQLRRMAVVTHEERPAPTGAPARTIVTGVSWTPIGPQPLRIDHEQNYQGAGPDSGEVTGIAIDPTGGADQIIYITTNNGGVWKSVNAGATWDPKTDFMLSLSMGAIALDPVDPMIVYAGTGNDFDGGGGAGFSKGVGIYRSIDGGDTWTHLSELLFTNKHIIRIVVPTLNVVLVATDGGLFRSVDGGKSFGANAPNFNDGNPVLVGEITDLALDKGNSATIFAAVDTKGIFVSTDGGITFPTNLFSNPGAPTVPFDKIAFAQSLNPNTNTIYALVSDDTATPRFKGLFKSTDKGANWTSMPAAAGPAAENGGLQAGYDMVVGTDPQDPNRVYIGFQELYLSIDGGLNFGTPAISRNLIHWDHHYIAFSPHLPASAPTPIYVGTDGGIARSNDGGTTWTNLNETLATNLFFGIDIGRNSAANNRYTYGGTQDTGTPGRRPGFPGTDWHLGVDGDGGPVVVDPNNPLRVYGRDGGNAITTSDGGANWAFPTAASTGLPADANGFSVGTPRGVDPNSSAIVYVSHQNQLFRSTDTGATFTLMHTFPAAITTFANVKLDSKVLMVGCEDGSVHRTANANAGAGSTWTALAVTGASTSIIGAIAIDPSDVQIAVIGYGGFTGVASANRTKHVFRTTDAGSTFTDIGGTDGGSVDDNFPDLPVHSIVIDPTTAPHALIVGTEGAVLRSTDNGATWQIYGLGMPTVVCGSLAIDTAAAPPLLRVGSYGRSVFELQRPGGSRIFIASNLAFGDVAQAANSDLTFDIFNIGDAPLTISDVSDSGANPNFSLVSPPSMPFDIAPGGRSTFTIRFAPTLQGKHVTTYSVTSNDLTHPVFGVSMSGFSPTTGPQVTGIIPSSGAAGGGTAVQILGSGFTGATAVLFGATAATGFTVDSDTQISTVSPPGAGIVDVTVVTPGGTTAVSPASRFTYVGAGIAVTSLNPSQGPETGGTSVIIAGSGFSGATQVLFGGFAATGFTVDNDSQVTAVSPAGSGIVDVFVATPSGTSAVTPADRFTYTAPGGGLSTGTTDTGTGTSTTTGTAGAEGEILHALADILRTGTDPEILEAQRILLRRIALDGNIIDSRIPPPKNITEIGGYINLLGILGHIDIRTQMLASTLGVAGPATPVGLSREATNLAFVSLGNDRPSGSAQPTYLTTITVRSDMADAFAQAIRRIHGIGCALPLYTPPRVLPRLSPGVVLQPDFLMLLGRVLQIAPSALLNDPSTDPLAIARRESDPLGKWQLVAREIDGESSIAPAAWIAFQATESNASENPPAARQYIPVAPFLADAGWYPTEPIVPPKSVSSPGSLTRFINITGLVRGETLLGDELALLYPPSVIAGSALVSMLSWKWNGTTFVPPA